MKLQGYKDARIQASIHKQGYEDARMQASVQKRKNMRM